MREIAIARSHCYSPKIWTNNFVRMDILKCLTLVSGLFPRNTIFLSLFALYYQYGAKYPLNWPIEFKLLCDCCRAGSGKTWISLNYMVIIHQEKCHMSKKFQRRTIYFLVVLEIATESIQLMNNIGQTFHTGVILEYRLAYVHVTSNLRFLQCTGVSISLRKNEKYWELKLS